MTREFPPISPRLTNTSHLKSLYTKTSTMYDAGNPTLSRLDIDFYFDTQSIIMINYLCMFKLNSQRRHRGTRTAMYYVNYTV